LVGSISLPLWFRREAKTLPARSASAALFGSVTFAAAKLRYLPAVQRLCGRPAHVHGAAVDGAALEPWVGLATRVQHLDDGFNVPHGFDQPQGFGFVFEYPPA
jgi:hypothetical protein